MSGEMALLGGRGAWSGGEGDTLSRAGVG